MHAVQGIAVACHIEHDAIHHLRCTHRLLRVTRNAFVEDVTQSEVIPIAAYDREMVDFAHLEGTLFAGHVTDILDEPPEGLLAARLLE